MANELKFKVMAISGPMPTNLFYKTLFMRVDDDGLVENVWCQENQIDFLS